MPASESRLAPATAIHLRGDACSHGGAGGCCGGGSGRDGTEGDQDGIPADVARPVVECVHMPATTPSSRPISHAQPTPVRTHSDVVPAGVVFFGASGAFSRPPLEALLRAGISVRAVVVSALTGAQNHDTPPVKLLPARAPRRGRPLPLLASSGPGTILQLAAERGIPVLEVARLRDQRTLDTLAAYQPDAICVACFSRRLPHEVLCLPRLGCLNVHPSLLPANRGPDPLFWTFRRGDTDTGVTIHLMDEGLDTGPILRQQRLPVPDGCFERQLEDACATAGGELLAASVADLVAGTARPHRQDEALATAYPWPRPDDYVITPDRPARWAYTFASGLCERTEPVVVHAAGAAYRVRAPLSFDAAATLDVPLQLAGDVLSLRCSPGVFTCRIRAE